ncbi:MAG: hypothetical protein MZW92_30650 [Comamonadaceae bacterium]|nr:hypothetical protein [Comamonadaceae bacterium]
MAIASSDSDFAPLVARLREKGCRVVGHRPGAARPATRRRRSTTSSWCSSTAAAGVAARPAAAPRPRRLRGRPARSGGRHRARRRTAGPARAAPRAARKAAPAAAPAKPAAPGKAPDAANAPHAASPRRPRRGGAAAPRRRAAQGTCRRCCSTCRSCGEGATLELRVASARLREAGLLTAARSSTKLLAPFGDRLELLPPRAPNHVLARGRRLSRASVRNGANGRLGERDFRRG